MTITSNDRRKIYNGNGVSDSFNGPRAFEASDISVFLVDADGAATQVSSGDYTITGLGRPQTRIVMNTPPDEGERLLILRTVPVDQPTDITNQGAFLPEIHEDAFDRMVMQSQQLDDQVSRTFRLAETSVANVDFTVPEPEALALLGWDPMAARLINNPPDQFVTTATAGVPFSVPVTAGQTTVSVSTLKTPWSAQGVFYNGIFQAPTAYTRNGTSIEFTEPLPADGEVVIIAVFGGPTNVTESDMLTFTPTATGGVTRQVLQKLSDTLSVKDFGAVGDGSTDDREAIRAAVSAASLAGGLRVKLPRGRYRVSAAADSQIVVGSNTMIYGEPGAVIFFDDDPAVAVDPNSTNRLFYLSGTEGVSLDGIEFEGSALTYDDPTTNAKQLIGGTGNRNFTAQNCKFRNLRHMALALGSTDGAVVSGCTFENLGRDGARFTHSRNVTITGNVFRNVSDDAVALHSRDTGISAPVPSGHVVTGNVFENSQGIRALGVKGITVGGNTFRRCTSHAVHIEQGWAAGEGNTPQFAINITGNTILDTLRIHSSGSTPIGVISVQSAARDFAALSDKPGVNAAPYDYNYDNDTDTAGPNPGMHCVSITNNVIARTLPAVAAFSDWGYGEFFDHRNTGSFWDDPAITDATFDFHAIYVEGPADGVLISGNNITGLSVDQHAFHFDVNGTSNVLDLNDVLITGNVVRDCPGHAVFASFIGTAAAARNFVVTGNVFDLDPYCRHTSHAADNTWSAGGACRALTLSAGTPAVFTGNTCKHLSQATSGGENAGQHYAGNFLWAGVTGVGNNAANKGVRILDTGQIIVSYDADPASATFGQVTTFPAATASAMPTTGFYAQGHFVKRTTPSIAGTAGSQYVVTGWVRVTTGSGHVAGTDWAEMRTLTGT